MTCDIVSAFEGTHYVIVSYSWTKLSRNARSRWRWQMHTALHLRSKCQETNHWPIS